MNADKLKDAGLLFQIEQALLNNPRAVEKAIVAIYHRQTQDERESHETKHSNGMGFSGFDAKYGTYLAEWVLSGRHLSGRFLDKARKMATKYRGQLLELAKAKLAASDEIDNAKERAPIQAA